MRYKLPSKQCILCGQLRRPSRFTRDPARCDLCLGAARRDTTAMRQARRAARARALRDMPFTKDCDKCRQPRPASYYPWIGDTATKGTTCNSCLRRRIGRNGGRIPEHAPETPAQRAQRAILARIDARERAREVERARVQAAGKRCADCWHVKPAEQFRMDTRRRDGLGASCIACERAYRVLQPQGLWRTARDALRALARRE